MPAAAKPKFTDPGKESAVIGYVVTGTFETLPRPSLIPAECFTDTVSRIIYRAALTLGEQGVSVCLESVNDWLAAHNLDKEIQQEVDSTNTVSWTCWSQNVDISLAYSPKSGAYCLSELRHLYVNRESYNLKRRFSEDSLSPEEFFGAWQRLHQTNGDTAFDFSKLDARRFDATNLHDRPEPILTLAGQAISTPGNLTSIFAQAKAGKTAVVGAIIGTSISGGNKGDYLDWSSIPNPLGKAVLHFDTEQSRYDWEQVILRGMRRASIHDQPKWLRSFFLTDVPMPDRRPYIIAEMARANKECGGILLAIIDGVGDLIPDVNDIEDANLLVDELHSLAIHYDTSVLPVLHENPDSTGKGNTKGRGHLGSQLERKSESNVRLVKDKEDVTTQTTGKSRHASITESKGPRFAYDPQEGMHVSMEPATKEDKATQEDKDFVTEVFNCPEATGGMNWTNCMERIERLAGIGRKAAEKRFSRYRKLKLITQTPQKHYREA